ncbi:hypothetical protein JL722_10938 [Aureococcus anophagefferens]|nr:hypothetical protein JL722_10938 [Aureococcus anophagefferens]
MTDEDWVRKDHEQEGTWVYNSKILAHSGSRGGLRNKDDALNIAKAAWLSFAPDDSDVWGNPDAARLREFAKHLRTNQVPRELTGFSRNFAPGRALKARAGGRVVVRTYLGRVDGFQPSSTVLIDDQALVAERARLDERQGAWLGEVVANVRESPETARAVLEQAAELELAVCADLGVEDAAALDERPICALLSSSECPVREKVCAALAGSRRRGARGDHDHAKDRFRKLLEPEDVACVLRARFPKLSGGKYAHIIKNMAEKVHYDHIFSSAVDADANIVIDFDAINEHFGARRRDYTNMDGKARYYGEVMRAAGGRACVEAEFKSSASSARRARPKTTHRGPPGARQLCPVAHVSRLPVAPRQTQRWRSVSRPAAARPLALSKQRRRSASSIMPIKKIRHDEHGASIKKYATKAIAQGKKTSREIAEWINEAAMRDNHPQFDVTKLIAYLSREKIAVVAGTQKQPKLATELGVHDLAKANKEDLIEAVFEGESKVGYRSVYQHFQNKTGHPHGLSLTSNVFIVGQDELETLDDAMHSAREFPATPEGIAEAKRVAREASQTIRRRTELEAAGSAVGTGKMSTAAAAGWTSARRPARSPRPRACPTTASARPRTSRWRRSASSATAAPCPRPRTARRATRARRASVASGDGERAEDVEMATERFVGDGGALPAPAPGGDPAPAPSPVAPAPREITVTVTLGEDKPVTDDELTIFLELSRRVEIRGLSPSERWRETVVASPADDVTAWKHARASSPPSPDSFMLKPTERQRDFDYDALVASLNAMVFDESDLGIQLVSRRIDVAVEAFEPGAFAKYRKNWTVDFILEGPQATSVGLVLRPAVFAARWRGMADKEGIFRYYGTGPRDGGRARGRARVVQRAHARAQRRSPLSLT